jgi:hypothetical protein
MSSPQRVARLAGALYLVVAILGGFAQLYVRATVYVPGDAATTATNVVEHAGLFRAGFVADLLQATCFLLVGLVLHRLLSTVNRAAARAMLILSAMSTAMISLNLVNHIAALVVATGAPYATALGPDGSDALVLLLLTMHNNGYLIAQIFFGLFLLPLGLLVYQSGMFPRVLGVALVVGCAGYLADALFQFSAPGAATTLGPYLAAPAGLAEFALIGWLLIRGVRVSPRDQLVEPSLAV